MWGLHFVKTGRVDPEDARLFARIQKYRIEADYGPCPSAPSAG